MEQRFKILFFLLLCFAAGLRMLQAASDAEQNGEALEIIKARMESLTQSLNGLPQPPSLSQKIQLPELTVPGSSLAPLDLKMEKEKKE